MKIDSKYFSFIIVKSALREKTSLSFIHKPTPPPLLFNQGLKIYVYLLRFLYSPNESCFSQVSFIATISGLLARTVIRLLNLLKLREFTNDLTLIHIVEK